MPQPSSSPRPASEILADLPLLEPTPAAWPALAAAHLPLFLSDHAVCEQQAALSALSLIGQYPGDPELVERMSALAAEEISHLRRVLALLHRRGWKPAGRRPNPWAKALRDRIATGAEPAQKVDRLLVGALIEARSCERFTLLHDATGDSELRALLHDLGPAEKRHWQLFHQLAARELPAAALEERWRGWLVFEAELARRGGVAPTVHG